MDPELEYLKHFGNIPCGNVSTEMSTANEEVRKKKIYGVGDRETIMSDLCKLFQTDVKSFTSMCQNLGFSVNKEKPSIFERRYNSQTFNRVERCVENIPKVKPGQIQLWKKSEESMEDHESC